jgi:hypothetical protein
MSTRTAARTAVRALVNEPVAKFFTDDDINEWIDEGTRDVSLMTLCAQAIGTSITTSDGVYKYSYPTTTTAHTSIDTIAIKTLINSEGKALQYISPDLFGRTENESDLTHWTEWGQTIMLSPTPGTAGLTLTPLFWIEVGCTAAGTIKLPGAYHHLIILFATYKAFAKRRSYAEAAAMFQQYLSQTDRVTTKLAQKFGIVDPKQTVKDHPPGD